MEEVFTAKTHYVCQTEIRDKKIQSVKCKTIEIDADDAKKPSNKDAHDHVHGEDSSSEEDDNVDFHEKEDEEISSKLVSIKQELKLQPTGAINIDASTFI